MWRETRTVQLKIMVTCDKKFELMLTKRAKAYGSSGLVV